VVEIKGGNRHGEASVPYAYTHFLGLRVLPDSAHAPAGIQVRAAAFYISRHMLIRNSVLFAQFFSHKPINYLSIY
jgi:hypothetical protein